MTEKDMFERILIAYKIYQKQNLDTVSVKEFLKWLYQQYGMTIPKDLKD